MRLTVCCLFFIWICCAAAYAQGSKTVNQSAISAPTTSLPADSAKADSVSREYALQYAANSIAMVFLIPDSAREDQFISQVFKDNLSYIHPLLNVTQQPQTFLKSGQLRKSRDQWVIVAIAGLLIYTALLNLFLGNEVITVIQSFYNKHPLSHLDKEGGIINSWAFIGLFILFSLAFGLVLYKITDYYNVYYSITGFQLFISLSVVIGLLFALKFLVLKFIGFVFNINNVISQYIAILNLTYFNIAFVLLFVAICFSLIASRFIPLLFIFTLGSIAVIFAWQYIRNSVNIISNFRFHKFYLFIYLCALEICPILILIKALNI